MTVGQVLGDIFTLQFGAAWSKIQSWLNGLQPFIQSLLDTLATDEGQILQGLVVTAAQDVLKNGISTASIVAAAEDVQAQLVSKNITMGQQVVFAALNAAIAAATPTSAASPVTPPAT